VAGRIETGSLNVGDGVVFYPSEKSTRVASIEAFNANRRTRVCAGMSTGVTLETQIYIQPGEVMCKYGEAAPQVGTQLKAHIFWLGKHPMVPQKRYKMKLAGAQVPVWLRKIETVLDASELTTDSNRGQIERHDVAECVLETLKPVAFDLAGDIAQTGRFVIIDNYEIAGGGIITAAAASESNRIAEHVERRQQNWQRSTIIAEERIGRYGQRSAMVIITGAEGVGKIALAKALEAQLFKNGRCVYYLGISNSLLGVDADIAHLGERDEFLRRLGEVGHLFTDAGVILITTASDLDDYELDMLTKLNKPNDTVVVNIGEQRLRRYTPDLQIDAIGEEGEAIQKITAALAARNYLIEYYL
jgi:bifunctional enzyme CysN/CysC